MPDTLTTISAPATSSARLTRLRCALLIGLAAALLSEGHALLPDPGVSDFADMWLGTVALLHGSDPYAAVWAAHPGQGLYYPLPALLLLAPFGLLPRVHAEALFAGVGVGALAFAGYSRPLLVACLSPAVFFSVNVGQWTPLLTASAVLPSLGFLWACKPSVGAALAVAFPSRRALLIAAGVALASVVVWPGWVAAWRHALDAGAHHPLVLRPGGFLLLLGLLRWRRPDGRLLAALALVPQLGVLYETVPLFLIPRTRWQAYALVVLSQITAVVLALTHRPDLPWQAETARQWPIVLIGTYLPALYLVLRRDGLPPSSAID